MVMSEFPAPPVAPDTDLRDFPYLPLDVVRLRDSDLAASVTGEEFRAAVLLWCAAWHQIPAGSLPDDDIQLSHLAGFGRVVKEWKKVRKGALHKWFKCSDGRLYHQTIAEKVLEATKSKSVRLWKAECARIRKQNERHKTSHPQPDFDEWMSQQCRAVRGTNVTSDMAVMSHATTAPSHKDNGCDNEDCHVEVTRDIDTLNRTELNRTEQRSKIPDTPARQPGRKRDELSEIETALRSACGQEENPSPALCDLSPILGLIDAGVSLDETILPVLRSKRGKCNSLRSWSFFVAAIRESHERRNGSGANLRPQKPADPAEKTYAIGYRDTRWSEAFLRDRISAWLDRGTWFAENWGPPPDRNSTIIDLSEQLGIPLVRATEATQ